MTRYVLDTNIIALRLKNNANVMQRISRANQAGHDFLGCPAVLYEVRRGLLRRDARTQWRRFEILFGSFIYEEFTRQDWTLAAELWAKRVVMGRPVSDADLLIAVFAINRDAVLVTDNEKDFAELGAKVENWKISNDND